MCFHPYLPSQKDARRPNLKGVGVGCGDGINNLLSLILPGITSLFNVSDSPILIQTLLSKLDVLLPRTSPAKVSHLTIISRMGDVP
jgi:hypothetical protein